MSTPASAPAAAPEPLRLKIASALFEIETDEPNQRSRTVLWCVCALIGVLLVWASVAQLDIVAVAQGRLVPQTYVKIVQPAQAGIVREILVKEGDLVQQGQVLVRMDPTINSVDRAASAHELSLQRLQLRRIEAELSGRVLVRRSDDDPNLFAQVESQRRSHYQAFLDSVAQESAARDRTGKELASATEVLKKLEATLPSYRRAADAYRKLSAQNLVGAIQAEEKQREALEKEQDLEAQKAAVDGLRAAIEQHTSRIAQLKSAHASDLNQTRLTAVSEITRLEREATKLEFESGLLELRAPQAGVVKELATTTVGAVMQPGTALVSLVPQNEPLLAEVQIENQDIGFVRVDQPVRLKVMAYQFQKYGMLEGVVRTVSADSSALNQDSDTERGAAGSVLSFKAIVELRDQRLAAGDVDLPLAAGMQLSAEILQGRRTVLEYLLSPVQRVVSEAATER